MGIFSSFLLAPLSEWFSFSITLTLLVVKQTKGPAVPLMRSQTVLSFIRSWVLGVYSIVLFGFDCFFPHPWWMDHKLVDSWSRLTCIQCLSEVFVNITVYLVGTFSLRSLGCSSMVLIWVQHMVFYVCYSIVWYTQTMSSLTIYTYLLMIFNLQNFNSFFSIILITVLYFTKSSAPNFNWLTYVWVAPLNECDADNQTTSIDSNIFFYYFYYLLLILLLFDR